MDVLIEISALDLFHAMSVFWRDGGAITDAPGWCPDSWRLTRGLAVNLSEIAGDCWIWL